MPSLFDSLANIQDGLENMGKAVGIDVNTGAIRVKKRIITTTGSPLDTVSGISSDDIVCTINTRFAEFS